MTRSSSGFTFAELLVSLVLMSIVVSAVGALVAHTDRLFSGQSAVADAQQRARVLVDTLGHGLRQAGAGVDRGTMSGPLNGAFAPIWPRRVGRLSADVRSTARSDAITLVHVPQTNVQTALSLDASPSSGQVVLSPCAAGALPCPLVRGTTLALFDALARVDLVRVLADSTGVAQVLPLGTSAGPFSAGSAVAEVVILGYYFDAGLEQLRFHDGDGTDQPVVDAVAGLTFEYFGAVEPPRWPKPPPGETNCLYSTAGEWRGGPVLQATDNGLAALPLAMFHDGPWCGDGGTAFDSDLLRVRRVRVSARLRVFGARDAQPDYRVVFDIAPPNLGLLRTPTDTGGTW